MKELVEPQFGEVSQKAGITTLTVKDQQEGLVAAEKILYKLCTPDTLLLGSGGSTPKGLYEALVRNDTFSVGAFGLIDERYGEPLHAISNELMIERTGLFYYLQAKNIPVVRMLHKDTNRAQDAVIYESELHSLFAKLPKRVAILGIGVDGHIAGIAPNRLDFTNPLFSEKKDVLVGSFTDPKPSAPDGNPSPPNGFGQRVTLTFKGLEQMTENIILAFGQNKLEAFEKMFSAGSEQDVPARFFLHPENAVKTLLITDQMV